MDRIDGVSIVRGGAARIADLRPLWESLHHHHAAVAPHLKALGSERSPVDSWAVRRAHYVALLAEPDAFVFLAEAGMEPIGYALVYLRLPEETWTTGRIAELETLAVIPDYRDRGVGTVLVQAVFGELRRRGITEFGVTVMSGNDDATRFYERLGMLPFMSAYLGRVPDA